MKSARADHHRSVNHWEYIIVHTTMLHSFTQNNASSVINTELKSKDIRTVNLCKEEGNIILNDRRTETSKGEEEKEEAAEEVEQTTTEEKRKRWEETLQWCDSKRENKTETKTSLTSEIGAPTSGTLEKFPRVEPKSQSERPKHFKVLPKPIRIASSAHVSTPWLNSGDSQCPSIAFICKPFSVQFYPWNRVVESLSISDCDRQIITSYLPGQGWEVCADTATLKALALSQPFVPLRVCLSLSSWGSPPTKWACERVLGVRRLACTASTAQETARASRLGKLSVEMWYLGFSVNGFFSFFFFLLANKAQLNLSCS